MPTTCVTSAVGADLPLSRSITATTAHRVPDSMAFRGLAISLVILFHYLAVDAPAHRWLFYALLPTHLMWSGVDLFFILSGLLIGGILLDNRESARYYGVFYARRVHRIFPLYYLMIALMIIGVWLYPAFPLFQGRAKLWSFPLFAQNLTGHLTHLQPWLGSSWSLAVEEQFYLVLPFVVRHSSRKAILWLMLSCIVGAPLIRTLMIMYGSYDQAYSLLPGRADALAYGVVVAMILRSNTAKEWIRNNSKFFYGLWLTLFAATPTILKWSAARYYGGTVAFSLLDSMYCLLVYCCS